MYPIKDKVQVNIPFTMLWDTYLDLFIKHELNPEIGLDATALERFSLSNFGDVAKRFHNHSRTITLHAPFVDLSPGSSDPDIRAITQHRFEQVLRLVPLFKPKTVVCHLGYDWKRYAYFKDSWIQNSFEIWSWLGTCVKDEGSQLMLENVYEHGPEDMLVFFEHLQDQDVGFCLDTGHQAAFSRTSLERWMALLGPYLRQLHLHDNCGCEDEHMAVGEGHIDFKAVFKRLKAVWKDPPIITLEPHKEGDLWPSFEYLAKIWPW
jgi:sugar phosphate isomerase/epimerase